MEQDLRSSGCQGVSLSCPARTYEEAEDWFYEYSGAVEDRFPEIVFEITALYKED